MIDFVKLQQDWFYKLLSEPALRRINIVQLRSEVIAGRVDFKLLTKTAREGRLGCGAVIEMPTLTVPDPAAPYPDGVLELSVLVAEFPTLNLNATTGTLLQAEHVCGLIKDVGHRFFMRDVGEFYISQKAIDPAEFEPGHVAYRVSFNFRHTAAPMTRVAGVAMTETDGLITLSCATADAEIFYTLNDTFPGRGNTAASRYTEPFQVETGTVIRTAAYKADCVGSDVDRVTINF